MAAWFNKKSERHKKRIAEGMRRSWRSGKRKPRRTKEQMRLAKLDPLKEAVEQRERTLGYIENKTVSLERRERQRWQDVMQEQHPLPKGVRHLGHGVPLKRGVFVAGRGIVFV